MKPIYKVAVIGGGTMGLDLAALFARQDMPVVVKEANDELASRAKDKFDQRVNSWLSRGKINESRAEQLKMLCSVISTYDDLGDIDLVVEAVPENMELKLKIFHELGELLPDAILSSNTSSIPIKLLSSRVKNPKRMAGLHFFNPPTKMPLVELISSEFTSADTIESLEIFAVETLAKKTIRVKDRPGFLVNVTLGAYLVPAIIALENTDVKPEDIDRCAIKFGWPMGPFTLLDMMGVDIVKEVVNIFFAAYGKRFSPSRLVDILVDAGRLGQKTGAGFYGGTEALNNILEREFPQRSNGNADEIFVQMMDSYVDESAIALEQGVASANDIETGALFSLGFPQVKGGPLHYADEVGLSKIVERLGDNACQLLRDMAARGETFFESW